MGSSGRRFLQQNTHVDWQMVDTSASKCNNESEMPDGQRGQQLWALRKPARKEHAKSEKACFSKHLCCWTS
jgi:5-methylcytosine-specific restriction endonuclease McrA